MKAKQARQHKTLKHGQTYPNTRRTTLFLFRAAPPAHPQRDLQAQAPHAQFKHNRRGKLGASATRPQNNATGPLKRHTSTGQRQPLNRESPRHTSAGQRAFQLRLTPKTTTTTTTTTGPQDNAQVDKTTENMPQQPPQK